MKIKSLLCGLVCLCLLSGCNGQPKQGTESSKEENITTSSSRTETTSTTTAPTTAVEEKHSSPEEAIKFYCNSINEKDIPACKTIIPPDFLESMLSENLQYVVPTNLLEQIEVKQFIKFEDVSDVNIWSVFPDSQQLKICYVDVYIEYIDKDMYGEGKVITGMPAFICSYQQGKWYVMMNE